MERFRDKQRVVVVSPQNEERAPLKGMTGEVVRLRREDNLAWVNTDSDLPLGFRAFPENRQYNPSLPEPRKNHILMDPSECEPAAPSATEGGRG